MHSPAFISFTAVLGYQYRATLLTFALLFPLVLSHTKKMQLRVEVKVKLPFSEGLEGLVSLNQL